MRYIPRKLIIASSVLAFILILLALWYFQRNVFSKDILKLDIISLDQVEAGQKVDYTLKYKNNGDVVLTNPRLTFEYPENSVTDDGKLRIEKNLDDIYPGEEKTISFSARIFGKENDLRTAKAWLKFQPRNLKASYEVSTTQTAVIKFSGLTFELDLPSRAEPGKEFSFSVNYFSNIDYPLANLRVKMDYPAGFEFANSQPQALGADEWQLPLLNKAQGGRITVSGRFSGNPGEQKMFKASISLWPESGPAVTLAETTKGLAIAGPTIFLSQLVNGQSDYSAQPGDSLHYEVFFKNIGKTAFENLFLTVNLEGSFFDLNSLKANNADFHPGDSSLVWDWKKVPKLKLLDENEEGKVEFWVNLKNSLDANQTGSTNLVLKDTVDLSPAREEFIVKVNAQMSLEQTVFFNDEAFGNSGPLPPKSGETTTLTIGWKVKNSYNSLKDVKVKAVLPSWVSLTGKFFPRESSFVFDSESREIIWEIGDLAANQTSADFYFQIALLPSGNQKGQAVALVNDTRASGDDVWVQEIVQTDGQSLTTASINDPGFVSSQGIVQ